MRTPTYPANSAASVGPQGRETPDPMRVEGRAAQRVAEKKGGPAVGPRGDRAPQIAASPHEVVGPWWPPERRCAWLTSRSAEPTIKRTAPE